MNNTMDNQLFENELNEGVKEVENIIYKYLPEEAGYQKTVIEAMNYSFRAGGKRLRPLIMYKTYKACGGNGTEVYPFMAALEMIHTYSLVHDDLPEMDNDDLRRGKPTTHKAYGQAMAVLAGDGLLNYAFETALKAYDENANSENVNNENANGQNSSVRIIKALKILSAKAGIYGMIGGQTVDVEAEKNNETLNEEQILYTYENKTSALLQAAFMIGAVLAGADENTVKEYEKAGYSLGIAFQLQDDILDITSTDAVLGKPVGSDEKNNKATYVSYLGMEEAVRRQKMLSAGAVNTVENVMGEYEGADTQATRFITDLIKYLVDRKM